ncbi:hypothetical protein Nocox_13210 [Nonomuraea coxensis DSM 45129]|uniref:Fungal lipase-like domain-containing protein n=1 Tax=Nonomuraea coxensis DSM 45129 TaxID=1122611 RepID=A0ABX8U0L1_9ACTN|nr:hypothetical protein [Nonomuraea coxensis]QYC40259.1 hypothetical protein Nocox_13210 [Nonomuraea coxensis DSM 45129]
MTDPAAGALRAAARELVDIALTIQDAAAHATAALADGALLRALPQAPSAAGPAYRALLRATTNGQGLGCALTGGGPLTTAAAKAGAVLGAESLAVRVLATSLRLRVAAVALAHPELTGDPMLARLIDAAAADRDLEAVRALRALLKDRGAVRALSQLAPVFGEVLALRALLDENPLNDATAWLIATGKGFATADPITGLSNRAIAVLDTGEGAARRVEPTAAESARLCARGSLLGFLGNISTLGTTGRALIQSVEGPDGVIRHVLQAPGMRAGRPDGESPQDLLGAFSSAVLASSPYSRALAEAVADYGLPPGAELALVGHSAGGAAVMNLAQDPGFCARHTVTHVVAVGSPVDFKRPADPRTWVASVTNQHDIIPTLDGQGAGTCFDPPPGWYVVDYGDSTHLFPQCHSIDHYRANLAGDLPEAREHIDERLTPFRGPVVRSQAYLLFDRPPDPDEFPFLTVPTRAVDSPEGAVELPIRVRDGDALTAYFAARPAVADGLLEGTGLGPAVRVAGRALVAVHAAWNRHTSAGGYGELQVGVVVAGPSGRRSRSPVWPGLLRAADLRRSGSFLVGSAVDATIVHALGPRLWGGETSLMPVELRLGARSAHVTAGPVLTLRGRLGPGLPLSDPGLVGYTRGAGGVLRSCVRTRGRARLHAAPPMRLAVEPRSAHPLAGRLRELGLDGARPLLCLSATTRQALRDAAVPVYPA